MEKPFLVRLLRNTNAMKWGFLLSLLFVIVIPCHGQDTISFHGNTLVTTKPETVFIADPVTGDIIKKAMPAKIAFLNSEKVYARREVDMPPTIHHAGGKDIKLSEYIFLIAKSHLELLADGMYIIDIGNLVIDKHGHLVYYEMNGIKQIMIPYKPPERKTAATMAGKERMTYTEFVTDDRVIPYKCRNAINDVVNRTLMQFPIVTPGQIHNAPVSVTGHLFSLTHYIQVENNVAKNVDDFFSL